ncbi:unnamed protein product [Brachionus calyciflorus]|uniref:Uncharacterized protein n=1 Tax=Brachionus calyciflorus TaxID=104777 RepID=A0A814D7K4_9BILA|nr:unnamed protein product [Brachionus calyciflorus]
MSIQIFERIFNQCVDRDEPFSFQILLDELNQLTPEKTEKLLVPYTSDEMTLIKIAKESLIRNFCMNPAIKESPKFNTCFLKKFFDFLNNDECSERILAQSLFLLHAGKTECHLLNKYEIELMFINYFEQFDSIEPDFNTNHPIFNDFLSIFKTLIQSLSFTDIIDKTIREIVSSKSNSDVFEYQSLKLIFFNSNFTCLYGFSGKDRIYVNIRPIVEFLKISLGEKEKMTIAKLNFIRLVLHETSHVVLRFKLNDLNLSSPFLDEHIKRGNVYKKVKECGFEAEKKLFKGHIDWKLSSYKKINLDYCLQVLDNILNGLPVDFDIERANVVVIPEENIQSFGFSISFKRQPLFLF